MFKGHRYVFSFLVHGIIVVACVPPVYVPHIECTRYVLTGLQEEEERSTYEIAAPAPAEQNSSTASKSVPHTHKNMTGHDVNNNQPVCVCGVLCESCTTTAGGLSMYFLVFV